MYNFISGSNNKLVPCDGPMSANNKIVMSLWTKPLFSDAFYFSSIEDFFAFWTLSVQQASKVYGWNRMSLYTDDLGLELLSKLGLRFYRSYTSLNRLSDYDASLWALGKIETYRLQTAPFLHIDHDVFLWQRLPCHIENASLVAQSPEYFMYGDKAAWWYDIERFVENFNLPYSWQAAIEKKGLQTSVNAGIMGGQDYSTLRGVASDAFYILNDSRNKPVWDEIHDKGFANTVLEQYTFARQAEFNKKEISYLFPSGYEPSFGKEIGYTHLVAGYKKEPDLRDMVWAEIQQNYPEYLPRIHDTANYLRSLIEQKNNISMFLKSSGMDSIEVNTSFLFRTSNCKVCTLVILLSSFFIKPIFQF